MPPIATKSSIRDHVHRTLLEQARTAAGNHLLSKAEQDALPDGVLKKTAELLRSAGPGTRIYADELADAAANQVLGCVALVNHVGPNAVSKAEVLATHKVNADAGVLVAKAYELITGRRVELPAPPPAVGNISRIRAASFTAADPYLTELNPLRNGGLEIRRGIVLPGSVTLTIDDEQVRPRRITAQLETATSGTSSNVATPEEIVEAIRKQLPTEMDVRVTSVGNGGLVMEIRNKPLPPHEGRPLYLYPEMRNAAGQKLGGVQLRGALRFQMLGGTEKPGAGATFSLRIDDRVFSLTARAGETRNALMRRMRDEVEAAGHTVDLREYDRWHWTFLVTG